MTFSGLCQSTMSVANNVTLAALEDCNADFLKMRPRINERQQLKI